MADRGDPSPATALLLVDLKLQMRGRRGLFNLANDRKFVAAKTLGDLTPVREGMRQRRSNVHTDKSLDVRHVWDRRLQLIL